MTKDQGTEKMNTIDIRDGRTYTDRKTTIRTVTRITTVGAGEGEHVAVLYDEIAGLNRGKSGSMPIETFAAFAAQKLKPGDIPAAILDLGLAAYGLDERTNDLVMASLESDGRITPEPGDMVRLEKMVGLGLATRIGRRMAATAYVASDEMLTAARRDQARPMDVAA